MTPPCFCTNPPCAGCPNHTLTPVVRPSDYAIDIRINGMWVASAKTYHHADLALHNLCDPPAPDPNPLGDSEGDSCDEEWRHAPLDVDYALTGWA